MRTKYLTYLTLCDEVKRTSVTSLLGCAELPLAGLNGALWPPWSLVISMLLLLFMIFFIHHILQIMVAHDIQDRENVLLSGCRPNIQLHHKPQSFTVDAYAVRSHVFITFRVSRRRREMYIGHARLCVFLCVSVPRCIPTLLHGPECNSGEWQRCPLVVHCWADLQSVHGFRCYDSIARTRNVSDCL